MLENTYMLMKEQSKEISKFRLNSDEMAQKQKERKAKRQEAIKKELIENSVNSAQKQAAVTMKWPEVAKKNIPDGFSFQFSCFFLQILWNMINLS